jgi:hypothetical protein
MNDSNSLIIQKQTINDQWLLHSVDDLNYE